MNDWKKVPPELVTRILCALPPKVDKPTKAAKPATAAVAPRPVKSPAAVHAMKAHRTAVAKAVKAPSGTPTAKR